MIRGKKRKRWYWPDLTRSGWFWVKSGQYRHFGQYAGIAGIGRTLGDSENHLAQSAVSGQVPHNRQIEGLESICSLGNGALTTVQIKRNTTSSSQVPWPRESGVFFPRLKLGYILADGGQTIVRKGGADGQSDDDLLLLELIARAPGLSQEDLQRCFVAVRMEYGADALAAIRSGYVRFEEGPPNVAN